MSDSWANYSEFKESGDLINEYYSAVNRSYEIAIEQITNGQTVERALDMACGAGDSTRHVMKFSSQVDAFDCSEALINEARANNALSSVNFVHSDLESYRTTHKYDFVGAAWLHNNLHTPEELIACARQVSEMLNDNGGVAFVVPSATFSSPATQRIANQIGWREGWYEQGDNYTKGIFSFLGSDWTELTVWEPLYLMRLYNEWFDLHTLDVKRIWVQENLMSEFSIEPPFNVIYGSKRTKQ